MRSSRTNAWRRFDPQRAATTPAAPAVLAEGPVRILGLDPGSRRTGFGLIDVRGADCLHRVHGCIAPAGESLASRLRSIFEAVQALIDEHHPDEVAIERVFMSRNADSAIKLGQARGAALSAVPHGTAVFEYAPRAIKLAVVGAGGAEKDQVAHMMRALLRLPGRPAADAADALAVAVCHANSRRLALRLAGQAAGRQGGR